MVKQNIIIDNNYRRMGLINFLKKILKKINNLNILEANKILTINEGLTEGCETSTIKDKINKYDLEGYSKLDELKNKEKKQIKKDYIELNNNYSYGVLKFKELHPNYSMQKIIENKSWIIECQQKYIESKYYSNWANEQIEFLNYVKSTFNSTRRHCIGKKISVFNVMLHIPNCNGLNTLNRTKSLHLYASTYTKNVSNFKSEKDFNMHQVWFKKNIALDHAIKKNTYQDLLNYILLLPFPIHVVICNSGLSLERYKIHFTNLIEDLKINNISYDYYEDLLKRKNLPYRHMIIVEMYSERDRSFKVVEKLNRLFKYNKPLIIYCSIFTERSRLYDLCCTKEIQLNRERLKKLKDSFYERKDCWKQIMDRLYDEGISYLYHITDYRNIKSIKEHGGLFSWEYCSINNIKIPYAGGNEVSRELDRYYNLQDYVRLSFTDDLPMKLRLMQEGYHLIGLKIKIDAALSKNTIFSDMNANAKEHSHGPNIEDLEKVDFIAVREFCVSKDSVLFKKHQAEVMVKTFVPLSCIINIDNPIIYR